MIRRSVNFAINCDVTKIRLNRKQRKLIEALIQENYENSFPQYCQKVDILPPNFYAVLAGSRPCTLAFLNKLLSGIEYQATMEAIVRLQPLEIGPDALDAPLVEHERKLLLEEEEDQDEYDCF